MAAMGLFDVKGGTAENPDMQIGSPQFERIEIALSPVNATGEKFVIETKGNGADTYYVQSATLNGKPYQSCRIPNSEIFKGGKLVLEMGTEPNENWGK